MDKRLRKMWFALAVLLCIITIGTIGYIVLEGYSFADALYMTIITISTVGFGEIVPLSTKGRLFTGFLVFSGMSVVIYAVTSLTTFFIEGEMIGYLKSVKMNQRINKIKEHYVVVGNGSTGKRLIEEFIKDGIPFVLIERCYENVEEAVRIYGDSLPYILGDATHDSTLRKAGIERATVLFSVLPSDADNLFVVLSSHALNANLKIVTRALEVSSIAKLERAGADKIISPIEIIANQMVEFAAQGSKNEH